MNIEVRYQSKSGNTARVAQAIAKELGVEAKEVKVPPGENVDLLFVGGAVYAGGISRDLKKFLKELKQGQAKRIAVFSTAMSPKNISPKVAKLIQDKGIVLIGEEYHARAAELESALPGAADFAKRIAAK